jgi:hypothetical protein
MNAATGIINPFGLPVNFPLWKILEFWSRVKRGSGCWIWNGQIMDGYGFLHFDRKRKYAHRMSWELHHGAIPLRLVVCHECDNPPCVNPKHMFLGTNQDNVRDRFLKGRSAKGNRNGSRIHARKLNLIKASEIRKRYAEGGVSQKLIGMEFGVSRSTVEDVIKNRLWRP